MSMRRVDMDRLVELVRLHRMGTSGRKVARLLGMSPNTERAYRNALTRAGLLAGPVDDLPGLEALKAVVLQQLPTTLPLQQTSTVEAWAARVGTLREAGLGPRAIYDRLRLEDAAFQGSYSAVKRLCRRIAQVEGVHADDVAIPVETEPGEVAQVDFGYVGRLYDTTTGTLRKAWCFVMVLAHSRHMVARVVFDQRLETWLRLHAEAFAELGGVVRTVVPDNLRAAAVRAAFSVAGEPCALNRSYRELARHYGFQIDPTPPRSPEKKGKVEASIKYVKRNFFRGREGQPIEEVRAELARWVREIAGTRVHGTTGRRPLEVFEAEERAALLPLPQAPYEPVIWHQALVHRDCHVAFERRLYSVPWRLVGKQVWVRATATTVVAYFDDERVATHDRRGRGLRSTVDDHLPDFRGQLRHRSRAYWEERADEVGPETGAYVREVFASDDVLSMLRTVQAIVRHLASFPRERAEAAARRARHFGAYSYGAIKNILRQGLDLQPLPTEARPDVAQARFRFARPITDLLPAPEEPNELN
jgi:transposase